MILYALLSVNGTTLAIKLVRMVLMRPKLGRITLIVLISSCYCEVLLLFDLYGEENADYINN